MTTLHQGEYRHWEQQETLLVTREILQTGLIQRGEKYKDRGGGPRQHFLQVGLTAAKVNPYSGWHWILYLTDFHCIWWSHLIMILSRPFHRRWSMRLPSAQPKTVEDSRGRGDHHSRHPMPGVDTETRGHQEVTLPRHQTLTKVSEERKVKTRLFVWGHHVLNHETFKECHECFTKC